MALLGRRYERVAGHAVSTARRLVYLATGVKRYGDSAKGLWRVKTGCHHGSVSRSARTSTGPGLVEAFADAAEWFAVKVAATDLRLQAPTCPGWTAYDVVVHLGNVHAWAATIVETGRPTPDQNDEPPSHRPKAVAEWYAGKAEDLYEVLRGCDPEAPCWNFAFGTGKAGFWRRRQLHETTVHGMDLALVSGSLPEYSVELSVDGIDEVLHVFLHRMHARGHAADLVAPVSIVATDTDRAWTVSPVQPGALPHQQPAPPVVADGATPGVDRVEGPAAALYPMLWKRLPRTDPAIRLVGDVGRVQRFLDSRLTA
jgi:uncharacterized protein (TIGR03083 family)